MECTTAAARCKGWLIVVSVLGYIAVAVVVFLLVIILVIVIVGRLFVIVCDISLKWVRTRRSIAHCSSA